jgi:hypothetical protein
MRIELPPTEIAPDEKVTIALSAPEDGEVRKLVLDPPDAVVVYTVRAHSVERGLGREMLSLASPGAIFAETVPTTLRSSKLQTGETLALIVRNVTRETIRLTGWFE